MKSKFVQCAVAAACVSGLSGDSVSAQTRADAGPTLTRDADGGILVRARRVTGPMNIDGHLDEPVYGEVPPIDQFIQQVPDTGAPVSRRTEAWVLYDDENVYVTCRCWEPHPELMVANDMRRGASNLQRQDNFSVNFDTFHDKRNGFLFYTTPIGGMREAQVTDDSPNHDWRAVWESHVGRFEGGWTVEMAFPFKTLRYPAGRDQVWGIQFRRVIAGGAELAYLTPTNPAWNVGAINRPSAFATLVGLQAPPAARHIEIRPYALSRTITDNLSTPPVHNDVRPDAGIDLKYGVSKSLTLDLTYRTDFAEVEEDEQQVNLTRFGLYFPEKRQFFLEGQGIFGFAGTGGEASRGNVPVVFYSRRIGLNGSSVVPVTGGARLSGKAGPWSIGALNVGTGEEDDVRATNFSVVRLKRNILRRSTVGGIFTRRSVSIDGTDPSSSWGLDTTMTFFQDLHVNGFLAATTTADTSGTDNLSYQGTFEYNGDRYGLNVDRLVVQENFNPQVGFLRRRDFQRNYYLARFSPRTTDNPVVRQWTYEASLEHITDNAGVLETQEMQGLFRIEFQNTDTVTVVGSRNYELLPAPFNIARGVQIPAGGYHFGYGSVSYGLSTQHRFSGRVSVDAGSFYAGQKQGLSYSGRVEVTPQLGVEPNISINRIDLPEGRFTTSVIGSRTTFTVTPRMFVAALLQYSSSQAQFSTNIRFRWEYLPGSEFFVVYTDGRSTLPEHGTELQNRGLVVKINRLVRF